MAQIIIIMGVSGCGKTTIGKLLAKKLELSFCDGDDFHTTSNIKNIKNNIPLNDKDIEPWLQTLSMLIKEWSFNSGIILACSALKESYREILSMYTDEIEWIYLSGNIETIKNRIDIRDDHFTKSTLLQSQFDVLEVPQYGLKINIEQEKEMVVTEIIDKLNTNV